MGIRVTWFLWREYLLFTFKSVGLQCLSRKPGDISAQCRVGTLVTNEVINCARKADGGLPQGLELPLETDGLSAAHCRAHLTADLSGMSSISCFLPKGHRYCVTHHPEAEFSPLETPTFPQGIT